MTRPATSSLSLVCGQMPRPPPRPTTNATFEKAQSVPKRNGQTSPAAPILATRGRLGPLAASMVLANITPSYSTR
jgi:hypothetical protein